MPTHRQSIDVAGVNLIVKTLSLLYLSPGT